MTSATLLRQTGPKHASKSRTTGLTVARHGRLGLVPGVPAVHTVRPPRRRGSRDRWRVRTSEHWYDDELEYDAVTEMLASKDVYVYAPGASLKEDEAAAQHFEGMDLHYAFGASSTTDVADILWRGKGGPPYFLRVRHRDALDQAASGEAMSPNVVENFWEELLSQNWSMRLDAGQGSVDGSSSHERLLIIAETMACHTLLLGLGLDPDLALMAPASLVKICVDASPQGADRSSWRDLSWEASEVTM